MGIVNVPHEAVQENANVSSRDHHNLGTLLDSVPYASVMTMQTYLGMEHISAY